MKAIGVVLLLSLSGCLAAPPSSQQPSDSDAAPVTCVPGEDVFPVAAFNASPKSAGNACEEQNALEADGEVAGLDLFGLTADGCAPLDLGQTEFGGCGCVGVDLGGVLPIAVVAVRARWSASACGNTCVTCDEGRTIDGWAGETTDDYWFLDHLSLVGDELADYLFVVDRPLRYVAICRDWFSEDRADAAVDSIHAICGDAAVAVR